MSTQQRVLDLTWLCVLSTLMLVIPGDAPIARTDEVAREQSSGSRRTWKAARVPLYDDERTMSPAERGHALARARVWREPKTAVGRAYLGPDRTAPARLDCRFELDDANGTTPKFDCVSPEGEPIRIKYGQGGEIPGEVAATRLLAALGFGADTVTLVERVRCYGCPKLPFVTTKVANVTRTDPLLKRTLDADEYEEFEWVAVERKLPARPIETSDQEGWAFFELDAVDPVKGGSPRAHVDALRLLAVFLAHWDNKSENQRLVCLSAGWPEGTRCREPFLLLQDVGATFGPRKVDLAGWKNAPMWEDRASCTVSMRGLPYDGATFGRARISEEGRQFLARLLGELSDAQLSDLFSGARFDKPRGLFRPAHSVADWVGAFRARVRRVVEGPSCPSSS